MAIYAKDLVLENFDGEEVTIDHANINNFQFGIESGVETSNRVSMYDGTITYYVNIITKDNLVKKYPRTSRNDSELLDYIITNCRLIKK